MSKEKLRKKLINLRNTNYKEEGISFVQFKKILNQLNLKNKTNIGGYYPINNEIGSLNILENLEKDNFKISLPVKKKKNKMDYYEWSFKDLLKVSNRGIPEPFTKKKVYPDVLIVPLVGFDKNKFRLGYGGGFYDRTFANLKKLNFNFYSVGFAFDDQKQEKLPKEIFDYKLDFVLTEKELYKFL